MPTCLPLIPGNETVPEWVWPRQANETWQKMFPSSLLSDEPVPVSPVAGDALPWTHMVVHSHAGLHTCTNSLWSAWMLNHTGCNMEWELWTLALFLTLISSQLPHFKDWCKGQGTLQPKRHIFTQVKPSSAPHPPVEPSENLSAAPQGPPPHSQEQEGSLILR